MPLHANLTGAELHEPKGVEAASSGTIYVSNGSGSGSWIKIGTNSVNQTEIPLTNKFTISAVLPDISDPSFILVPVIQSCSLDKVIVVLKNAITSANSTLTFTNEGVGAMGTLSVPFSGSGEGSIFVFSPSGNNDILEESYVKIASNGNSSTTSIAYITLQFSVIV